MARESRRGNGRSPEWRRSAPIVIRSGDSQPAPTLVRDFHITDADRIPCSRVRLWTDCHFCRAATRETESRTRATPRQSSAVVNRLVADSQTLAEPNIPHFEILFVTPVNTRAAIAGEIRHPTGKLDSLCSGTSSITSVWPTHRRHLKRRFSVSPLTGARLVNGLGGRYKVLALVISVDESIELPTMNDHPQHYS